MISAHRLLLNRRTAALLSLVTALVFFATLTPAHA